MIQVDYSKDKNLFYIRIFGSLEESDFFQVFREVHSSSHYNDKSNTISDCRQISRISIDEETMENLSNFIARQKRTSEAKSAILVNDFLIKNPIFKIYLKIIRNIHNSKFRVRVFKDSTDVTLRAVKWINMP